MGIVENEDKDVGGWWWMFNSVKLDALNLVRCVEGTVDDHGGWVVAVSVGNPRG